MPRVEATMSAGFQITVPSLLRKKLDLKPGDRVVFDTDRKAITVEKAETQEEQVKAMVAEFDRLNEEHRKRMTPEEKKFAKMAAGWTVNQYHEYFDDLPETDLYMKEKYGIQV